MTTYFLPSSGWAILLPGIVQSARPDSVIRCGTAEMRDLALDAVREAERQDVRVELEASEREGTCTHEQSAS